MNAPERGWRLATALLVALASPYRAVADPATAEAEVREVVERYFRADALGRAHAGATARNGNEISSQPGCPGMDISRFGPCRAWPSRAIHFRSVR